MTSLAGSGKRLSPRRVTGRLRQQKRRMTRDATSPPVPGPHCFRDIGLPGGSYLIVTCDTRALPPIIHWHHVGGPLRAPVFTAVIRDETNAPNEAYK